MAQINVSNLTFGYEGSYDTIFENVSFSIDTSWKLGFVGRNGKGKTTFLQLLLGKYEYQGAITRSVVFDYFLYPVKQKDLERTAAELMEDWKAHFEDFSVLFASAGSATGGHAEYQGKGEHQGNDFFRFHLLFLRFYCVVALRYRTRFLQFDYGTGSLGCQ